jgi:L-lactate dehydrogenase complex protein LldG
MTSGAREDILDRTRAALRQAAAPTPAVRDYRRSGELAAGAPELVALLTDRLVDYRAHVHALSPADIAGTIAEIAREQSGDHARLVVAPDFAAQWRHGWDAVEDHGLTAAELDATDGAVTTCTVAIAETGTLVLDAGVGQGRRAITLVPDLHVCVVRHDQVVQTVPDALRRLDPIRPLTFVSGPSATSDIELQRVEGVHGPRTLHVLLVTPG